MSETFERRNMEGSVFREVNLGNSKFEDVNLGGASFKNVNLAGVSIRNANLVQLNIDGADVNGLTIFGIRVDELIEAELDRKDPERASIRIHDYFNPQEVREVMARLDQLRAKFCEVLRSKDADLLATRPEPEEWSAIEVVRHLVGAEDDYLNHWILRNDKPYIRLGLPPSHIASELVAEMEIEANVDLETLLVAWENIHVGTRKFVAGVTDEELRRETGNPGLAKKTVGSLLQLLAHHDLLHIRQAEAALAAAEQAA